MYHPIKELMHTVHVDQPDPRFGNVLLEQFGGANGELGRRCSIRYKESTAMIRNEKTFLWKWDGRTEPSGSGRRTHAHAPEADEE